MTHAPQTLDREGIALRIPHRGRMCLLSQLLQWDEDGIVCSATGHRDPAHPLRSASGLLAPCAIEYAAQAMALHGALLAAGGPGAPQVGFLASARGVALHRLRLDDLPGELRIHARRQAGDATQVLYRFDVSHAGEPLADGRATVVLDGTPGRPRLGPAGAPASMQAPGRQA